MMEILYQPNKNDVSLFTQFDTWHIIEDQIYAFSSFKNTSCSWDLEDLQVPVPQNQDASRWLRNYAFVHTTVIYCGMYKEKSGQTISKYVWRH